MSMRTGVRQRRTQNYLAEEAEQVSRRHGNHCMARECPRGGQRGGLRAEQQLTETTPHFTEDIMRKQVLGTLVDNAISQPMALE